MNHYHPILRLPMIHAKTIWDAYEILSDRIRHMTPAEFMTCADKPDFGGDCASDPESCSYDEYHVPLECGCGED